MKFKQPILISDIATQIGATIIGDHTLWATGLNEIHKVECGDITFVDVAKYFEKSLSSAATFIILNEKIEAPKGKALLFCEKPFEAYNHLAQTFCPLYSLNTNISATAKIHFSAVVEPNVVIGEQVVIGKNCHIQANTYIGSHTIIGDDVIIQPGALVGIDAFYYKKEAGNYHKWHTCGRVIVHNKVEIGAGCTIARGVSGDTIIGEGSKLDAQCHIGHGVVIGKNCLFAAQVGIGGKTILGDNVLLYGQVGIAQNLNIASNVIIGAKSGVSKDLEEGKTYFGYPAQEIREAYKDLATLRQIRKK